LFYIKDKKIKECYDYLYKNILGVNFMKRVIPISVFSLIFTTAIDASGGKEVFETYCWGCHHQTAVAFGPPFEEIASKRTAVEIKAMITSPKDVSKVFGYKRNAMPSFQLSEDNLTAITDYILSYKKDTNKTEVKKPYPNIAFKSEDK
jgi:cytochrome c5